ncbi:uncharacterized protein EV154DRAFT_595007 [Mucor mucedo]|uniref:uncharacterized protein n=1 Tax=Mucor mucedo TaxID=29922 RepID=UPI00221F8C92|nr:uncharacterized protein EV154DRAFT_595007 [Mucor mucedo]KAI7887919.1 hypothetical protein EV154DRAFT_595007 [Mucor mucedo]
MTPISPVDFNLKKRDRPPFIISRTNASTPMYTNSTTQKEFNVASTRIAQTLIMQGLDSANESIQALLLELIVTKELRISNVRYNVPKPCFLVISVLPQGYNRLSISSQLEIRGLAERATKVHVNIDITRYIRDIVVGIRTHPRVKGGLTARCSQDLVIVTK